VIDNVTAGVSGIIQHAADGLIDAVGALDSAFVLWAALVVLITLAWSGVDEYDARTRRIVDEMRRFGERFVLEFERPLSQADQSSRPIDSRVVVRAHPPRVAIFIAPAAGRRYPNLSDHRTNVEYDVSRILRRVPDPAFVCHSLCARGRWVVVTLQLQVNSQQAGDA
jgi:hypothetical protein